MSAPAIFGAYLRSYLRLALPLFVAGQALLALYPPDAALAWPLRLALLQWLFQFCNGAALGYWNGLQRQGEANRRLALALLCKHALALLLITQWQASAVAWLLPFVSGTGLVPAALGAGILVALFGSIGLKVARMSDQAWAERPARSRTIRAKAPKIAVESAA